MLEGKNEALRDKYNKYKIKTKEQYSMIKDKYTEAQARIQELETQNEHLSSVNRQLESDKTALLDINNISNMKHHKTTKEAHINVPRRVKSGDYSHLKVCDL